MIPLRDIEMRHLAALVAVVDEGSFAKAATALGFTQSAVSQQIAGLERAIGMPVFDRPRGPRPAALTPAGTTLLDHARRVLGQVGELADALDRLRRGISGRLVVGTFQSVSAELLPGIIGRMLAEAPGIEVRLVESDDQGVLVRKVLDDELDLTFTVDAEATAELVCDPLGCDPFVVIAARSDPIGPFATVADLDHHPLIGQPATNVCQVLIERRLTDAGVHADYVFRSQDNGAVQGMVRSGMGRAVMPRLAIDPDDPGIRVLALDPPVEPRTIQISRRAGRTLPAAADQLVAIARDVAATVLEPAAPVGTSPAGA